MSAAWLITAAILAQAPDDAAARKVKFEIKQALLYLKDKAPAQAQQVLTPVLAEEPGKSDPLAWLAMARAHYDANDLLGAGKHVVEAESRNLSAVLTETWAKKFYEDFQKSFCRIRLRTEQKLCERARFAVSPVNPLNPAHETLVAGLPGWSGGEISVPLKDLVFLPAGRYDLGKNNDGTPVNTREFPAGQESVLVLEEIGAACATDAVVIMDPNYVPPEPLVPTWLWVVGGIVAAGGAATVAALVATSGGPKEFLDSPGYNPFPQQ